MTNPSPSPFHKEILRLDAPAVCEQITSQLRSDVWQVLHKRGAVVGLSGGIDSSVTLGLSVQALGADHVLGVIMPERESSPESMEYALVLARAFGVQTVVEDITGALDGFGCYRRRDEAIARVFPEFDPNFHRAKITLPQNVLDDDVLNVFSLTIVAPDGTEHSARVPIQELLQIIAASNFKQRSRMAMLYYHAEACNYAVVGTSNKHEYAQGFFVKFGDGAADVDPIVHLYKGQVYQLGRYLGVPDQILRRPPTPDTYSAGSTAQEFFFQLPYDLMDLLWFGQENDYSPSEVAQALDLTEEQVARAYRNFQRKKAATNYLRVQLMGGDVSRTGLDAPATASMAGNPQM
jgi:NAD+ synthase